MPRHHVNVSNARLAPRTSTRGDYANVLDAIQRDKFCPFCEEHFGKNHHEPVILKNDSWIVTHNAWPYEGSTHHFLLIARRHVTSAAQLRPKEWQDFGSAFKGLERKFKFPGATVFMRSADTAITGASVQHLHAQVIVGKKRGKGKEPISAIVGFKRMK